MNGKAYIFLLLLLSFGKLAFTQKAILDTTEIYIGDPVKLYLLVPTEQGKVIRFQHFEDTIMGGIEILETPIIDSVENGTFLRKTWLITSFEDSVFNIPPIKITIGGQEHFSNPTSLRVKYFIPDSTTLAKIDTVQLLKIFDIKGIEDTPLTFAEFWERFGLYIIFSLIGILLAIGTYFFIKKRRENRPVFIPQAPKIPPHITALSDLKKLKAKELWQKEKVKLYYTELTDILRHYIEARFAVPAIEYTSDEILGSLKNADLISPTDYSELAQILNFADLTKFAKLNPLPHDNDRCMQYAFNFIESTKHEIEQEPDNQIEIEQKNG